MVLKSCQLVGGRGSDAAAAAAAVEMIHNFSLVHDDIMDNDEVRHGVPTTHSKFGVPLAILAGDVLFAKAYRTVSESGAPPAVTAELVRRLARGCVEICEGQQMDIAMANSRDLPTQAEYVAMIRKKTAALFDVSCAMGAVCARAGRADVARLSRFGRNLGVAFQMADDVMGVVGDPRLTKKPVANDLREGKKSLPILVAMDLASGAKRRIILRCFGNSRAARTDLEAAAEAIRSLGVEAKVRSQALKYADRARAALRGYDGPVRDELLSLLDFAVKRSL